MARPSRSRNHAAIRWLSRLLGDRSGATAIEYGLILALTTLVMVSALRGVASVTTGMWNNVSSDVQKAH